MKAIKQTVFEGFLLITAAAVLGFSANTLRSKGSIELGKNYFETGGRTAHTSSNAQESAGAKEANNHFIKDEQAGVEHGEQTVDTDETNEHPEHEYQKISFQEVVAVFEDPETAAGANVFIDARSDQAFAEGHIPGAIQLNPYDAQTYIDNALNFAESADQIIVYCGGGKCEDSIFACRELMNAGVQYENIYLYTGGITEWTKNKMPLRAGEQE